MRERFNVNKIEVVVAISFLIVGILLYVLTDNFLGLGWLCCLICIVYFFVYCATTLIFTMSVSFESKRTTTNIRFLSGTFLALGIISNAIFTFVQFGSPIYILINGIMLLIWLAITYFIKKADM